MAAYSALVAVWNRAATGRGDHLDLSIHEAMIQTIDTQVAGASVRRAAPALPVTSAVATGGFGHPAFPTADGLVRPLVVSSRQWVALREWVGDPEALRDEALATYGGRNLHPDVMAEIYEKLFAGTSTEAICDEAQRRNVPVTPVLSPAELIASEPMHKRGTFATTAVDGQEGVLPGRLLRVRRPARGIPPRRSASGCRHRERARRAAARCVAVRRCAFRRPRARDRGSTTTHRPARARVHAAHGRSGDRQALARSGRRRDPSGEPRVPRPEPGVRRCGEHVVAVRHHQPQQAQPRHRPPITRGTSADPAAHVRQRRGDREPRARARSTTSGSTSRRCATPIRTSSS